MNIGLTQTKAVIETPSRFSATSLRMGRPVCTLINDLKWWLSNHTHVHYTRLPAVSVQQAFWSLKKNTSDLSPHLSIQVKLAAWNKEKAGSWYSQYRKGKQVLFSSFNCLTVNMYAAPSLDLHTFLYRILPPNSLLSINKKCTVCYKRIV